MPKIVYLPCLDSPELAARGKRELYMERDKAAALGHSAVQISRDGLKSVWPCKVHFL